MTPREQIARTIYDVANKWLAPNFPATWKPREFEDLEQYEQNLHYDYADAVLALQGWQPIETAPKDGTRIWLFEPKPMKCMSVARWVAAPHDVWIADRGNYIRRATHWQPLPEPPPAPAETSGAPKKSDVV